MNNNFNNGYSKNDFIGKQKPDSNKKIYFIGNAVIAVFYIICCTINFMAYNANFPDVYLVSAFPMLFIFVGWWFFISYSEKLKKKREKCTQVVLALLSDYKVVVDRDVENGTTYTFYAIYEYVWNNVSHRVISKEEYIGEREKAIQCKLLINPNNPLEFYEIENEHARIKKNRRMGIIFMAFGLFFFFMTNIFLF